VRSPRRLILLVALAAALTVATAHRVCALVFACGCTWVATGGATHCNIHHPQPPHCPACRASWPAAALGVGLFGAWSGLLHTAWRARRARP